MNFDHLKKLDVKDKTAMLPLTMIRNTPVLIVRPATESNKPYFNEILRRSSKAIREVAMGGKLDVGSDVLETKRIEDRELFPKHVIVGWERVVNSDGENAEFNEENCKAFVAALPDWIFDQVGIFCRRNSNFVEQDIDQEDMENLAKN